MDTHNTNCTCVCGKTFLKEEGLRLIASFEEVRKEYLYCSYACILKRINEIPEANKEMGTNVVVDSFTFVEGSWVIVLKNEVPPHYADKE